MKYIIKNTNRFRKDYKLTEKRNLDISLVDVIIAKLAQGIPLPWSNRNHELTGSYVGHRESHIQRDWLLIYRIENEVFVLTLIRTGTHRDLF